MPQAWVTSTPKSCWKPRIRLSGQAEPPISTRFSVEKRRSLVFMCANRPCHTVGTAAEKVTPSASISS